MDPITLAILIGLITTVGGAAILGAVKYSPRAMKRMKRWFLGTNFVILGPPGAGKTSFINYLRHNHFADVYPTTRTLTVDEIGSFPVDKGGDFKLEVSNGIDTPGDLPLKDQIGVIISKRPQTLILWTALTDPDAEDWLASICLSLNQRLLEDRTMAKKLKSLTVVMNKKDEVTDEQIKERDKRFHSIIANTLRPALGDNVDKISIIPCTLLMAKGGEKAANTVLLTIISSLIKAKPLTKIR